MMRADESDKKKIEKAEELITHKIAKDIEKTDRKRKLSTEVDVAQGADTGADQ